MNVIKHDGETIENVTGIRLQPVKREDREPETAFRIDTAEGSLILKPVHPIRFSTCCSTLRNLEKVDGYFVFPESEEEPVTEDS
jgi:hypothetical protein